MRFDPTEWVAPGRIALGSQAFHDSINPYIQLFYFSLPKNIFKVAAITQLNFYIDSVNSSLNTSIFHFDRDKQQKFFDKIVPRHLSQGWPFVFVLVFVLSILPIVFFIASSPSQPASKKRYRRFLNQMKKKGFVKAPSETASEFAARCSRARPSDTTFIERETQSYIKNTYQ